MSSGKKRKNDIRNNCIPFGEVTRKASLASNDNIDMSAFTHLNCGH